MFRFHAHAARATKGRTPAVPQSPGLTAAWPSLLLQVALTAALTAPLIAAPALAFNETGGSGLIRTEQAYSLPIGRPLVSLYAGVYSHDFTPGTSRLLALTPSVTLGLGGGFEGSAALSFEGLTSKLDGGSFTRRLDLRRRALQAKLRWTSDIGGPRLRAGVLGHLTLPLGEDQRPGATLSPGTDRDVGVMGLLSTNLGWFNFPLAAAPERGLLVEPRRRRLRLSRPAHLDPADRPGGRSQRRPGIRTRAGGGSAARRGVRRAAIRAVRRRARRLDRQRKPLAADAGLPHAIDLDRGVDRRRLVQPVVERRGHRVRRRATSTRTTSSSWA